MNERLIEPGSDEPKTDAEKMRELAESEGWQAEKASTFGFWPVDDGGNRIRRPSAPVPTNVEGAPIVDAARGLSARRRGEIALSGGPVTPRAKLLAEKALGAMRAGSAVDDELPPAA